MDHGPPVIIAFWHPPVPGGGGLRLVLRLHGVGPDLRTGRGGLHPGHQHLGRQGTAAGDGHGWEGEDLGPHSVLTGNDDIFSFR